MNVNLEGVLSYAISDGYVLNTKQDVKELAKFLESRDIVKVIRCNECKYFYKENNACILHSEVTSDNKKETLVHMKPTDFCSYAKRNKQNDEKE